MKQKIVMQVQMKCEKCRTKALEVVAEAQGVSFVGLEGNEKNKVVVIGDGVDPVKLTKNLRKKVGHADITSVAEVVSGVGVHFVCADIKYPPTEDAKFWQTVKLRNPRER